MALRLEVDAIDGGARATTITTHRGTIRTPCFMPVGTRGTVRAADAADLDALGAQVVLANTYHLMLRPGRRGGRPRSAACTGSSGWDGHVLTDSGGFQVFSLDDIPASNVQASTTTGVTFRSTYDGVLAPAHARGRGAIQEALGADIQMQLDVCPAAARRPSRSCGSPSSARSSGVSGRSRPARRLDDQTAVRHRAGRHRRGAAGRGRRRGHRGRRRSASTASPSAACRWGSREPRWSRPCRPPRRGAAGRPAPLRDGRSAIRLAWSRPSAMGVDLFDCVLPTRSPATARSSPTAGTIEPPQRPVGQRRRAARPEGCPCRVCARWSRATSATSSMVGEPTALRLATLHNLAWTLRLVERMRAAIEAGTFAALRREVLRPGAEAPPESDLAGAVDYACSAGHGPPPHPRRHLRPDVGALHPPAAAAGARPTRPSSPGSRSATRS